MTDLTKNLTVLGTREMPNGDLVLDIEASEETFEEILKLAREDVIARRITVSDIKKLSTPGFEFKQRIIQTYIAKALEEMGKEEYRSKRNSLLAQIFIGFGLGLTSVLLSTTIILMVRDFIFNGSFL